MSLVSIALGEWLPDLPDFGNPGLVTAKNILPLTVQAEAVSYGPMPTTAVISDNALTDYCLGFYSAAVVSAGGSTWYDFAADSTKLYRKTAVGASFSDVSQALVTYSPNGGAGFWSFATFGARLIATNGADAPQTFLIGTDAVFSDLSSDAPTAYYVAVIRDFVMLAKLRSPFLPYRVQWSAIGDPESWPTPGTDAAIEVQSDYQDLQQADYGGITGIMGGGFGGADGAVWHEKGIYRIHYVGSPAIFEFNPVPGAPGTYAPRSIVGAPLAGGGGASLAMYLAPDGFHAFDGTQAVAIGARKFDKAFFDACGSETVLRRVLGVADPQRKLVFWAFSDALIRTGQYNRLLVYNWEIGKAALCELDVELQWLGIRFTTTPTPRLCAFQPASGALADTAGYLAEFTGDNMPVEVATGERQLFPGRKARVQGVRPLCDGGEPSIAMAARDLPGDAIVYGVSVPVNVLGECPQRVSGRYMRFQLTLPLASEFSHLQGMDVRAAMGGIRR